MCALKEECSEFIMVRDIEAASEVKAVVDNCTFRQGYFLGVPEAAFAEKSFHDLMLVHIPVWFRV